MLLSSIEEYMKYLIRRVVKNFKRNDKRAKRANRGFALLIARRRLLAQNDYESVSVADITSEAGISVGAFYGRFSSKDAFLASLIRNRFVAAGRRLERELDPQKLKHAETAAIVRAIIEHMMQTFHGAGAGVVRAALKRAHLSRDNLQPLCDYRSALSDRAHLLLVSRVQGVRHPERAVRAAVQIAEATALDALLHEAGILRPGSLRMASMLKTLMLSSLGVSSGVRQQSAPAIEEAMSSDEDGGEQMLEMPVEDLVVATVSPEPVRSRRRTSSKVAGQCAEVGVLAKAPKAVLTSEAEAAPTRPRRRRLL